MGRREVRDLMEQLKHEGKTVFFSTHILSDAEALCDHVAIINKGELQGVGAVADLTSSVDSKVELVWQGPAVPPLLRTLGTECHVTGTTVRAIIPEANQDVGHRGLAEGTAAAGFSDTGTDIAGRLFHAEVATGSG